MSSNSSNQAPVLEMLLFGSLIIMLLTSVLRWNMASKENNRSLASRSNQPVSTLKINPTANPLTNSPPAQPQPQVQQTTAPAQVMGTHRILCANGNVGLNFRPQAGFSQPLFVVPCGAIVTVTGSPVNVQNETWSPVTYANRNGWSATKLLQPIR